MKGCLKRAMSAFIALTMVVTPVSITTGTNHVNADETNIGNLADKVTGQWYYELNGEKIYNTNEMLLDKLPTRENKGSSRWTTDNYDNSTGPIDIGGFGTAFMWNYTSDAFGNSVYAIPLAYKATANGMFVTKPTTVKVENTLFMNAPENGDLSDFIVGTGYNFSSSKVDKVTEWTYDVVMEKSGDESTYMKNTIVQGSPFSFFELKGSTTMTVRRNRRLPSDIVSYNGTTLNNSTMVVIRVYDNQDLVSGYGDYDYYALYVPEGTTWTQGSGTYQDDRVGELTMNFPDSDHTYMTLAWLCESNGQNDSMAKSIAEEYRGYAYNVVTDTETSFDYNWSTGMINTNYEYTVKTRDESTKEGTIMGILPHQYKNMTGYTYLDHEARTIRGNMKYLAGTSYNTTLRYSGILPAMMDIEDADKATLQQYVDDFMEKYGPTDTELTKESYKENSYDTGKKLNRALQVMEAAEQCGDTESANKILQAMERELADWYTWSGEDDEKYFYYDEGVGSLLGFPQEYYTVDGLQDHHFHYGYFIQASAQIALRDSSFVQKYGNIIQELIGDIATTEKNTPDSRYPQLRYFSTYEGHSWASGAANFADGNNQESSSEAINAWASLILYGQATDNKELTELGIYMYQTEISAVKNYWFDIDGDILDPGYKQTSKGDSSLPLYIQASMVWGGKYTYAAWWTAEPLQVQGINILPMTSASFYYAADTDYIINNWKTANINESYYTGEDKEVKRWNELWSAYLAIADPEKAMEYFDPECSPEAGDSKAHAYHYIMALDKAGTPDLSISSSNPLSSAFKDKEGNMTYVTYNASDEVKTVEFSDGTQVVAQPRMMTTVTDKEAVGKAQYSIEHYLQNTDGSYSLVTTEKKSAKIGAQVTANGKTWQGYELDTTIEGTQNNGTVVEDGSLTLKLYYKIVEIKPTQPTQDDSKYTKIGTYDGYDVSYYIIRDDFGIANVQSLDAGMTFYVVYSGDYNATNTTGYLNGKENQSSILTGVYNLNLRNVQKDSYNTIKAINGNKQIYIVVKYGNPTTPPDLSDYEGEVETQDPNQPVDAVGVVVGSPKDNIITIAFRESTEQIGKGQLYNIYIDDQLVESGVGAGNYTFENVNAGRHTVKITAVLNNIESQGVSETIKVNGDVEPTSGTPSENQSEVTTNPTQSVVTSEQTTVSVKPTDATTLDVESKTEKESTTAAKVTPTTKISVKRAKIKKVKRIKAKKAKISLKKMKNISGYQIKYSITKKFKKKKTKRKFIKITKLKKNAFVLKKLKAKKKYYIKVRAYKLVNGKKKFGRWSKRKVIKIKKR